ncbi:MAG: histidine ammonia-lyase [Marinilabiliales bacterium]|nr:MAG: histidine ammonia-lyase [Marinilabiliales bacterium]
MIEIGAATLQLEDFNAILYKGEKIELNNTAFQKVEKSFQFLKTFSEDKLIYGINTGLGPMAQFRINEEDTKQLQYNLIRSHAAGAGNKMPHLYVKATMLARLNTLMQAHSGISPEVVTTLTKMINKDICPVIYEHGGVGASGDLVQLAHLALGLIGEGNVTVGGVERETAEVFKEYGIKPIEIHIREGLALINGTSVMTGIGMINVIQTKRLLEWSVFASTIINEIMESYDDHFSEELNGVKHHKGQKLVAGMMREIASTSKLIRKRADFLYKKINDNVLKEKVQEYYSIRCIPQILGPILDVIESTQEVLVNEVNSANDNPIIDAERENVYHGGNFHGDYVSFEMDKLKIAITKLSMLAERQINFLMNNKLNDKLPPFVNLGTLGLNLGMQGVQFTATSTTAENKTLSYPMYINSIPNNNDNQDIVSMGTNSALLAKKIIENAYEVLSIEVMTLCQAIDYLNVQDKLSDQAQKVYHAIREVFPVFTEDTPRYIDIIAVNNYISKNNFNLI